MILEKLTIALEKPYAKAGPDNPYMAKLEVSYDKNKMTVVLSDDVCRKVLALAADEITEAASIQIRNFVNMAIAVSDKPMIEGDTQ